MILTNRNHLWGILSFLSYLLGLLILIIFLNIMDSKELQLSPDLNGLIILGNLIPLAITCLVIFTNLKLLPFKSQAIISIVGNEMIFIPHFNVYLCIFECSTLSDVHVDGFNLITNIHNISIELVKDEQRLRIFLYANSKINLYKQIEEVKPLLDNIFPNSSLLNRSKFRSEFSNYSIYRNGDYLLIKQGKYLFIPTINQNLTTKAFHESSTVFRFSIPRKTTISQGSLSSNQFYSLTKFRLGSFFDFFGEMISTHGKTYFEEKIKEDFLYRVIIRYDLDRYALIDKEGSDLNLQHLLAPYITKSTSFEEEKEDISPPKIPNNIELDDVTISNTSYRYNQICKEFCTIYKSSDELTLKLRNCSNRRDFCRKALNNQNLTTFLNELVKRESKQRRDVLLSDLLKHMSFQQLYCLIANYLQFNTKNYLDNQMIRLLIAMIQKQIEQRKDDNSAYPHHSIMDFLQLTPNQETEMVRENQTIFEH